MKIEFITNDQLTAKKFAIEPIKKAVPEWYKNIPMLMGSGGEGVDDYFEMEKLGHRTHRTIRHCVPVLDYLTSGYLIRASAQIKVKPIDDPNTDVKGLRYYTAQVGSFEMHGHAQCPVKIRGEKKTYIKLTNPWLIRTPPGYSCLFYQPFYNLEERYTLLPAIVDTDKHDVPVNFPGYLNGPDEIEILPGEPVMAVFPFKRDEWKMEIVVRDTQPSVLNRFLTAAYKTMNWSKKSYK